MTMDDYSDFDWDVQPSHIYDIEFRKRMVREFNIEKDRAWAFFMRVEVAASSSPDMAFIFYNSPSEKTVRDTWLAISSCASNLMSEIESADDVLEIGVANELGWYLVEQDEAKDPALAREPESFEESIEQDAFYDRRLADGKSILEVVRQFSRMANAITDELPLPKRGPKLDQELWHWVQGIKHAWQHDLGRKFTRDIDSNGEPISEAARFVAMATENTPYDKNKALHMMKRVISSARHFDNH
jgi:hypothetical protein